MFKHWGVRYWTVFVVLWAGLVGLGGTVYQPASDVGRIAAVTLAACLCAILVYAFSSRAGSELGNPPAAADSPDMADPAPVRDNWQKLGADPQAREESIHRLFDSGSGVVEFETQWDFDYSYEHGSGATELAYSSMSFHLARPLAEMGSRERELLRGAYLLYNANLIDAQTWRELTFCSVYGAGSASIVSCEYREPVALPFSDDAGAIRYYADCHEATVDNTERKLLTILESLARQPGAPAVVRDSMRRLQDASG